MLGIVVRPAGGLLGKTFLTSVISLRTATDFGIDSVVDNMPILRIHTERFPVTLVTNVHLASSVTDDSVHLHFGRQTVTARGPEGVPVQLEFYASETELLGQLKTATRNWIKQAEVPPEQAPDLAGIDLVLAETLVAAAKTVAITEESP